MSEVNETICDDFRLITLIYTMSKSIEKLH